MKFLTIYTPAKQNAGPPSTARVSCSGDEITVTDGPFAESKELIVGFAILEVKSKEECLEGAGTSSSARATA